MIAKPMPVPVDHHGILTVLLRVLRNWLAAIGAGQDGPAGHLPEDLLARSRHG